MPVNISSLVTLTVVVIDSNANVSARLSSGFQGSTGLTVTYGITPNCDANTMMTANGMAGDTLKVVLASLQPDLTYCYSIYFNQRVLSFKVVGVFRSGGSCISIVDNITHMQNVMQLICQVTVCYNPQRCVY